MESNDDNKLFSKEKVYIILSAVVGILVIIYLSSVTLINEDIIKEQIEGDISYKSLSFKKFPYPKVYLHEVELGNIKIPKVNIKFPFLSLMSFSHKIKNIELQNPKFLLKNEIASLQDFHMILENIWLRKKDISNLDLTNIEIFWKNNQIIQIPSLNLSCAKMKCSISAPGFTLSITQDEGDLISMSAFYLLSNHQMNFSEKYDTKTRNFIGNFQIDGIDKQDKIQAEIVGNREVTHFKNISANYDLFLKGNLDYAIFGGKTSILKANIDYLNMTSEQLYKLISNVKFYNEGLNLDIQASSGKILDQELVNIKLIANSTSDAINITHLSGNFESDSKFNFIGKFTKDLEGRLDLNHSDLNKILRKIGVKNLVLHDQKAQQLQFASDIHISDNNYNYSNINAKINDQLIINGQFGARFISDTPRIISCLQIDGLDFNDKNYPIINNLLFYLTSIASDMKSDDYVSKFDLIKNLRYKIHQDLYFTNSRLGAHKIDKIHTDVRIKDAHVEVKKLDITSEDLNFSAEGELQSWGIKPIFFANIHGTRIQNLGYYYDSLVSYFSKNIDFKKMQFNLSIAMDQFISNDKINVQNLRAEFKSDDSGGVKISNLIFDIFGGRVTSTSYLTLGDLSLEGVFGYNNFLFEPIIAYLSKKSSLITGVASANGKFKFNLENYTKFISEMELSGNYIAKFINIQNFGIDDYIEQITKKSYDAKLRLEYDTYYATLKGQTQIPLLSGSLEVANGLVNFKDMVFTTKYSSGNVRGSLKLDGLKAGDDLKSDFTFIFPSESQANQAFLSKTEPKKATFSMKIQDYIFAPISTLDLTEMQKIIKDSIGN